MPTNERSPFLIVDPVTAFDADLFRRLPSRLALDAFRRAIRYCRLLHSPEGALEAYRAGRLLPSEDRLIQSALEERLGIEPEHASIASLGYARLRDGVLSTYVEVIGNTEQERAALAAFWHWVHHLVANHYQLVSWGGSAWSVSFVVRRSILLGIMPSIALPVGRRNVDTHFDVAEALANWDRSRTRPLELAALQYGLGGPWEDGEDADGADTATGIRAAIRDGDFERARTLGATRLSTIWQLYERLAPAYLSASAA